MSSFEECGGNKFGFDCEQVCIGKRNRPYSCRGYQFCLPDPYGCSCVTGYTGLDCLTPCIEGTFGAGCAQVCHCNNGTCDMYTGKCTGNDTTCQSRWTGSNCQECKTGYFGENCELECTKCTSCHRLGCLEGSCYTNWLNPYCEVGKQ
ncbi:multiple epidermal growth factor-like domains protein 10 [Anneissia japonica]|uniref:multiple epidermal growth factor-like domains protein 10 n=1 Tax=Anneissia japonica TaxID=1529436 RepID=UPI001425A153|nr:multiple epidermal growth factor-like domains protein 10 [Anneissia japonica]